MFLHSKYCFESLEILKTSSAINVFFSYSIFICIFEIWLRKKIIYIVGTKQSASWWLSTKMYNNRCLFGFFVSLFHNLSFIYTHSMFLSFHRCVARITCGAYMRLATLRETFLFKFMCTKFISMFHVCARARAPVVCLCLPLFAVMTNATPNTAWIGNKPDNISFDRYNSLELASC